MAFGAAAITSLFSEVKSHAESLGLFQAVEQFEPTNAPGNGLSLSIWLGPVMPVTSSGLAAVSLRVTFLLRIYSPMLQRPLSDIDPKVLEAVSTLLAEYSGHFTLDGEVREVELFGMHAQPAYLSHDGKEFRIVEITLPVIVNDAWTEAA